MRYSIELRDRIYVKGYGFLSFAKNMSKRLSNRYGQKRLDSANNRCNKNNIEKSNSTAEATGDLIGNKSADKITSVSKKLSEELHNNNETEKEDVEIATPEKIYISPEKGKQIIDEFRLVPKTYV